MAYTKIPSIKWQSILDIEDEEEQGKAATEYVMYLENEVSRLSKNLAMLKANKNIDVIDIIMKCKPFGEWLEIHDKKVMNDTFDYCNNKWTEGK